MLLIVFVLLDVFLVDLLDVLLVLMQEKEQAKKQHLTGVYNALYNSRNSGA